MNSKVRNLGRLMKVEEFQSRTSMYGLDSNGFILGLRKSGVLYLLGLKFYRLFLFHPLLYQSG